MQIRAVLDPEEPRDEKADEQQQHNDPEHVHPTWRATIAASVGPVSLILGRQFGHALALT